MSSGETFYRLELQNNGKTLLLFPRKPTATPTLDTAGAADIILRKLCGESQKGAEVNALFFSHLGHDKPTELSDLPGYTVEIISQKKMPTYIAFTRGDEVENFDSVIDKLASCKAVTEAEAYDMSEKVRRSLHYIKQSSDRTRRLF